LKLSTSQREKDLFLEICKDMVSET